MLDLVLNTPLVDFLASNHIVNCCLNLLQKFEQLLMWGSISGIYFMRWWLFIVFTPEQMFCSFYSTLPCSVNTVSVDLDDSRRIYAIFFYIRNDLFYGRIDYGYPNYDVTKVSIPSSKLT